MNTLTNGKSYLVNSRRKGTFVGTIERHDETWATIKIKAGRASAMLEDNQHEKGEEVTVRREFCVFTEQPEGGAA
jgi:hypothetical protein